MPMFNSLSQLQLAVEKQVMNALQDDVSRVIKDALQKHVLDNIYNVGGSSDYYNRTYELLRSIAIGKVIKIGDVFHVSVYFDSEFTHESWWGSERLGISAGEQVGIGTIAEWLNGGKNMFAPHTEGFMENTIEELQNTKTYINAFIGYLSTKGILIK